MAGRLRRVASAASARQAATQLPAGFDVKRAERLGWRCLRMRLRLGSIGLVLVCVVSGTPAWTQTLPSSSRSAEPVVPEKAGKELHAYRIKGSPPKIDGRLDDEVW